MSSLESTITSFDREAYNRIGKMRKYIAYIFQAIFEEGRQAILEGLLDGLLK